MSNPVDRFPHLFNTKLWKQYPYLLPCLTTSSLIFVTFLFALFFFKEVSGSPYQAIQT